MVSVIFHRCFMSQIDFSSLAFVVLGKFVAHVPSNIVLDAIFPFESSSCPGEIDGKYAYWKFHLINRLHFCLSISMLESPIPEETEDSHPKAKEKVKKERDWIGNIKLQIAKSETPFPILQSP